MKISTNDVLSARVVKSKKIKGIIEAETFDVLALAVRSRRWKEPHPHQPNRISETAECRLHKTVTR